MEMALENKSTSEHAEGRRRMVFHKHRPKPMYLNMLASGTTLTIYSMCASEVPPSTTSVLPSRGSRHRDIRALPSALIYPSASSHLALAESDKEARKWLIPCCFVCVETR